MELDVVRAVMRSGVMPGLISPRHLPLAVCFPLVTGTVFGMGTFGEEKR